MPPSIRRSNSSQIVILSLIGVCLALIIGISIYLYKFHCGESCKLAQYQKGLLEASAANAQPQMPIVPPSTYQRDRRVLDDPLYPPLNRTDSTNFIQTRNKIDDRTLYIPTSSASSSTDSYRLVGYLTNTDEKKDSGGNSWKLFARQIDRNGRADFYIVPTNKDMDIKIPLTEDVLSSGYRVKNIDDIPSEVRFKTPLLNDGPYVFVEIPKADLQTNGSTYM